ncbi:hypothetical protein [Flavobacterium soli]|uniref:hypothetical protein n=1 Tax=Flavobacterium soli TaxID=344881 RepID=UPI0003FA5EBC|nr:hypothetical protein [Flavobacterium soli]
MNKFLKQITQDKSTFEKTAVNYVKGFAGILMMESANTKNPEVNVNFIVEKYNEMFSAFKNLASERAISLFEKYGEKHEPFLRFAENEFYVIFLKKHGDIQKLLREHKNYDSHLSFIL